MKATRVWALCLLIAVACLCDSANARPQYKTAHDKKYKDSKISKLLQRADCTACHFGKSRSNRNDYGKALSKVGLTKEKFDELKTKKAALSKHIQEALVKVLKEKSESGDTFGKRINAGMLPGTTP